MSKRKTHEEYVNELKIVNPDIIPIEQYIDWRTPIYHLCTIHNHKWKAIPNNILRGGHCPECRKDATKKSNSLSHNEYISRLQDVNPTVIPLENYINKDTPILHKCLIHDIKWYSTPSSILQGSGCSKCKTERLRDYHAFTHEEYVNKVKEANPTVEVIGTYINANTNIEHRCLIHNHKWIVSPYSILQGHGCKYCQIDKTSEKLSKTQEQYIEELSLENPDVICLGEYKNINFPIWHKCVKCGYEWEVSPASVLLQNSGCPCCSSSKGEDQIKKWLDSHNYTYVTQKKYADCKDERPLPFDFYLPDLNKCIEYDGKQHFEIVDYFGGEDGYKIRQYHDSIKTKYCEDNNIPLLRIPYYADVDTELSKFLLI